MLGAGRQISTALREAEVAWSQEEWEMPPGLSKDKCPRAEVRCRLCRAHLCGGQQLFGLVHVHRSKFLCSSKKPFKSPHGLLLPWDATLGCPGFGCFSAVPALVGAGSVCYRLPPSAAAYGHLTSIYGHLTPPADAAYGCWASTWWEWGEPLNFPWLAEVSTKVSS